MKEKLLLLLIGIIVGIVIISLVPKDGKFGGSYTTGYNIFSGGVVATTTSCVGATSTEILARNIDRQYAYICIANDAPDTVWLQFRDSKNTELGIALSSSTQDNDCYEIDSENLYVGAIHGYPVTSTTTVYSIEK